MTDSPVSYNELLIYCLWAEVRDWSLRPEYRLREASEQILRINNEKQLISHLRPWLNIEGSLLNINLRGKFRDFVFAV